MSENCEKLNETIYLEDNIKLIYQQPDTFFNYYAIYYGQKNCNNYFRSAPGALIGKVKYLDCGYFIMKDNSIIGGVFLKQNYMSDLFLIPPFSDYNYIADKIINYIKKVSRKAENIFFYEVLEPYVPFYKSQGCTIHESGYWMIRPAEAMSEVLSDDYESKSITADVKNEIADVIVSAYKANPSFTDVYDKAEYVESVERFLKNSKDNEVIYNSSRIVVHKKTNKVIGCCLHMDFEGYPLITNIVVEPKHQGMGVGNYLLRHSISYSSKGYSAVRLYVYEKNKALQVYEHLGFIKNGTINDMKYFNE